MCMCVCVHASARVARARVCGVCVCVCVCVVHAKGVVDRMELAWMLYQWELVDGAWAHET